MNLKNIFVESEPILSRAEILRMLKGEAWPGIMLAVVIGLAAYFLGGVSLWLESLIIALVLGAIFGAVIRSFAGLFSVFLPGLIVAPIILIPLGLMAYGINLNFNDLFAVDSYLLMKILGVLAVGFALVVILSKLFKVDQKLALLLAVGSTVCGASAITIATPVAKANPDETSKALLINILAGALGVFLVFYALSSYVISIEQFAVLSGATAFQTAFVKILSSLGGLSKGLASEAMAIKTMRVLLLVAVLPLISYIGRKKIFIPWYLSIFVGIGVLFSFVPSAAPYAGDLKKFYGAVFPIALAAIGLNTNFRAALKNFSGAFFAVLISLLVVLGIFIWVVL
ncbi:MAG: putative sulfate exporter family transporter [Patescibacteria group bacterium]